MPLQNAQRTLCKCRRAQWHVSNDKEGIRYRESMRSRTWKNAIATWNGFCRAIACSVCSSLTTVEPGSHPPNSSIDFLLVSSGDLAYGRPSPGALLVFHERRLVIIASSANVPPSSPFPLLSPAFRRNGQRLVGTDRVGFLCCRHERAGLQP